MKRQTMANLAKDMDMWIEKRDKLSKKTDELKRQKELLLNSEVRILYGYRLLVSFKGASHV